jgi:hypothetical protein
VGAIHSKDSVGQLTINNLNLATKVGVNNSTKDLTASFTGTSGTSDEAVVQLNKAGSKAGTTTTRSTIDVSSGNSIESVKIEVLGGDNYVTVKGGTANKTLTVVGEGTGVADINTTDLVTKVDANAYKGKLDLTLGGISNVAVTGTSQDDAFRFGTTLNSADTLTGGDGNDVLYATLSASQTPTVTGVEKGVLTFSDDKGIYNASKTTGMTEVDLRPAAPNANATISNAKAELGTINILADSARAAQFGSSGDVAVNYVKGAQAETTVNIGGAAAYTIGDLTIANADTVTIQAQGKGATIAGAVTADEATTVNFIADGTDLTASGSNSFDKLSTLNVTATDAMATVNAGVSGSGDVTIDEVNVKGTDAGSELNVTVDVSGGGDVTLSSVNFEVNGDGGTQSLTLKTAYSGEATISALNIKAAADATATVVLDVSGGYDIQGGSFEGEGNITIEGSGSTDAIDLRNIDRSTLSEESELTIKLNASGDVYGTNGDDTIDVSSGDVTVFFANEASNNGYDTIKGFEYSGGSGDKLDFSGFLGSGSVSVVSGGADATSDDLDFTDANSSGNVGYLYNVSSGTLDLSKVVTTNDNNVNGEVILADNGKAVVLVTADTDGALAANDTFKVYYVYDADSSSATNFQVELVGTVDAGGNISAAQLLAAVI